MTTTQDIISRLRQPVSSLTELEELLAAPLISLHVTAPTSTGSLRLAAPPSIRQTATLQSVILAHIYPTWENQTKLHDLYFVPPKFGAAGRSSEGTRTLVLSSLTVLTAPPLTRFAISLLDKLVHTYDLDLIWDIASAEGKEGQMGWDRALAAWMSIPGKVANVLLGSGTTSNQNIPSVLSFEDFATRTSLASERIVWSVAQRQSSELASESDLQRLIHLVSKLISTGHFSESSSSFIPLALPQICARSASAHSQAYMGIWSQIAQDLPGPQLQTFTKSLLNYLDAVLPHQPRSIDSATPTLLHPSRVLYALLGSATRAPPEVWHVLIGSGRTWSRDLIRGILGWAANPDIKSDRPDEKGVALALEHVLARWSDPQYVSRALLSEHQYLTSLLVLTLGALAELPSTSVSSNSDLATDAFLDTSFTDLNDVPTPTSPISPPTSAPVPVHPLITATSTSPQFLQAVGAYLSQRDEAVRRCGMLVAEIVAGSKLDFGDWDGEKEWQ
ncbi:telomere binding protein, partial [Ceratobasidium sp. 392]